MGNIVTVHIDTPHTRHSDGDYWKIGNKRIIVPLSTSWKPEYKTVNALDFPDEKLLFSIKNFETSSDRLFVKIYCHDYGTDQFSNSYFYSSRSDGYFWRFCFISKERSTTFHKGYNYVTTTFINMKLQKFIFDEIEKFNVLPKRSEDCINERVITDETLLKRLIGRDYISDNLFFRVFDSIFASEFQSTGKPDMFNEYSACCAYLNQSISNYEKEKDTHPAYKSFLELLKNLKAFLTSNGVFKDIEGSKTEHFKKVYRAFDQFFTHYFEYLLDTKDKVISNRVTSVEGYQVVMNIYTIYINYRLTNQKFKVYYMVYKFKKPGDTTFGSVRKALLQIIPERRKINKYGLDSPYVSGGYLINKIFDYKSQKSLMTFGGKVAGTEYLFMGDIVNMESLPYDSYKDPIEAVAATKVPVAPPKPPVVPVAPPRPPALVMGFPELAATRVPATAPRPPALVMRVPELAATRVPAAATRPLVVPVAPPRPPVVVARDPVAASRAGAGKYAIIQKKLSRIP